LIEVIRSRDFAQKPN